MPADRAPRRRRRLTLRPATVWDRHPSRQCRRLRLKGPRTQQPIPDPAPGREPLPSDPRRHGPRPRPSPSRAPAHPTRARASALRCAPSLPPSRSRPRGWKPHPARRSRCRHGHPSPRPASCLRLLEASSVATLADRTQSERHAPHCLMLTDQWAGALEVIHRGGSWHRRRSSASPARSTVTGGSAG